MSEVPRRLTPAFQAINKNLSDLQRNLSEVRQELDALKAGELAHVVNEPGSDVYIIPKPDGKPDTGELRRRRYYLHEKISDHFSPGELVSLMYSLGVDPGDVPGEAHNEVCLQFVMYCERHGIMQELLPKLKKERPRSEWKI